MRDVINHIHACLDWQTRPHDEPNSTNQKLPTVAFDYFQCPHLKVMDCTSAIVAVFKTAKAQAVALYNDETAKSLAVIAAAQSAEEKQYKKRKNWKTESRN